MHIELDKQMWWNLKQSFCDFPCLTLKWKDKNEIRDEHTLQFILGSEKDKVESKITLIYTGQKYSFAEISLISWILI